jgi:hypothetical protein
MMLKPLMLLPLNLLLVLPETQLNLSEALDADL